MYDFLIVGAGFSGAVLAERVASQLGKRVLVIDRRDHIGGNAYDHYDDYGVLVHAHGPHIFHTNAPHVVDYLSRFTAWQPYEHRVRGWVDGRSVPLPFNFTSMKGVFGAREGERLNRLLADEFGLEARVPILKMRKSPSREIRRVADAIYEKVYFHYNMKQWGISPEQLDASVSARVSVRLSHDDRYFQDRFQNMPARSFTAVFERLLSHPLIEVRTGLSFEDAASTETFNRLVYTGPIDEFFGYAEGPLPYRSLHFEMRTTASSNPVQSAAVENYPTPVSKHRYTRSTEFRLLTGQDSLAFTTQAFEYPEAYEPGVNEPYYPIPREETRAIYRKYAARAGALRSVVFTGRLADYKYYNIDQAVARAFMCFETSIAGDG